MTQMLTGLKDILLCREIVAGTSNMTSTGDAGVSDVTHWKDAAFGGMTIDGATEDGNYFVGYKLLILTGVNAGLSRSITAYTPAVDEFTLDSALPAVHVAGNTALICKPLRAKIESWKPIQEKPPRDYNTLDFEGPSPLVGKQSADLTMSTEWLATGTSSATADFLNASFGPVFKASTSNVSLVVAGGGVADLWITLGDYTKMPVGSVIAVESDAGPFSLHFVQAHVLPGALKDRLTIWPPLALYPTAGKAVEMTDCWVPQNSGQNTFTLMIIENGGRQILLTGCSCTVKPKEFSTGGYAELQVVVKANDYAVTEATWPAAMLKSSTTPPMNYAGIVSNQTVAWSTPKVDYDPGLKLVEKPAFDNADGRAGFAIAGREGKVQLSIYDVGSAEITAHDGNSTFSVLAVMGSATNAAGCCGFCVPQAKSSEIAFGDQDGMQTADYTLVPFDDSTVASAPVRPVLFYHKT